MPDEFMTSRSIFIRIDKPPNTGIVISGLQIIEPGFAVEVVAPVANLDRFLYSSAWGDDLSPCAVDVGCKIPPPGVRMRILVSYWFRM